MNARRGGPAEAEEQRIAAAAPERQRIAAAVAEEQRLAAAAAKVTFHTTDLLNFLVSILLIHQVH